MKYFVIVAVTFFSLASCDSSNNENTNTLSNGLKIFITAEKHVGDFGNDPTLTGTSPIEKADDFCNKSSNKPDESIYKALIVDGVNRDAVSLTDWVLQASTTYYRPYNNVEIGTTSSTQIFTAFWTDLTNTIAECDIDCQRNMDFYVWTGIDNAGDFSNNGDNCNFWEASSLSYSARYGIYLEKDGYAFSSNIFGSCSTRAYVYCVEQP